MISLREPSNLFICVTVWAFMSVQSPTVFCQQGGGGGGGGLISYFKNLFSKSQMQPFRTYTLYSKRDGAIDMDAGLPPLIPTKELVNPQDYVQQLIFRQNQRNYELNAAVLANHNLTGINMPVSAPVQTNPLAANPSPYFAYGAPASSNQNFPSRPNVIQYPTINMYGTAGRFLRSQGQGQPFYRNSVYPQANNVPVNRNYPNSNNYYRPEQYNYNNYFNNNNNQHPQRSQVPSGVSTPLLKMPTHYPQSSNIYYKSTPQNSPYKNEDPSPTSYRENVDVTPTNSDPSFRPQSQEPTNSDNGQDQELDNMDDNGGENEAIATPTDSENQEIESQSEVSSNNLNTVQSSSPEPIAFDPSDDYVLEEKV